MQTERCEHPRFGEKIRGNFASEDNPIRDGYFVRVIDARGARINPGVWYQLTDKKGKFWDFEAKHTTRLEPLAAKDNKDVADDLERALAKLSRTENIYAKEAEHFIVSALRKITNQEGSNAKPAEYVPHGMEREHSKLLYGFMLECGTIGAESAGINLARGIKQAIVDKIDQLVRDRDASLEKGSFP